MNFTIQLTEHAEPSTFMGQPAFGDVRFEPGPSVYSVSSDRWQGVLIESWPGDADVFQDALVREEPAAILGRYPLHVTGCLLRHDGRWVAFRDPFAAVPLWLILEDGLVITTDPQRLVGRRPLTATVRAILSGRPITDRADLYADVERVIPGTILSGAGGRIMGEHTYWPGDPCAPVNDLSAAIRSWFEDQVRAPGTSLVLTGGGLDSAIIATVLATKDADLQLASMVSSECPEADESAWARHLARTLGAPLHPFEISGASRLSLDLAGCDPIGPSLHPGWTYEADFRDFAVQSSSAAFVWTGVGADQLFDRRWESEVRRLPAGDVVGKTGTGEITPKAALRDLLGRARARLAPSRRSNGPAWSAGAWLEDETFTVPAPMELLCTLEWDLLRRASRPANHDLPVQRLEPFLHRELWELVLTHSPLLLASRRGELVKPVLRRAFAGAMDERLRRRRKTFSFDAVIEEGLLRRRAAIGDLCHDMVLEREGWVDGERFRTATDALWRALDDGRRGQGVARWWRTLAVEQWIRACF